MMNNNSVAIVIDNAFTYAGTENICNYMSDCLSEVADVTILSLNGGGSPFYDFKKVKRIISFENTKRPLIGLCRHIILEDYEFVFVISMGKLSFLFSMLRYLMPRLKKRKLIACEHVSINSFPTSVKTLKIWALKKFDKVITLTERDYKFLSNKRIDVKKIPNPIKFRNFNKTSINQNALAIGRLEYQKGFDILIDIWSDFHKENPSWTLNIAGSGNDFEKLAEKIESKSLHSSVKLLGKVDNVDELYKKSDIFLMTSRYEGLPLVLLEAKAWSIPSIAFDCPTGPREIISDNEDGFLVPIGNKKMFIEKLNLLSHSNDLLFKMSANTLQTHMRFSEETIRNEWKSLLSEGFS